MRHEAENTKPDRSGTMDVDIRPELICWCWRSQGPVRLRPVFFTYPDMKTSRPEYHTESDGYIRTRSQVRVQQGVTIILRLCTRRRKGLILHASKQAFSHALYSYIVTYSYVFTSRDAVRIPNFLVLTFPIIFLLFTFPVVFS